MVQARLRHFSCCFLGVAARSVPLRPFLSCVAPSLRSVRSSSSWALARPFLKYPETDTWQHPDAFARAKAVFERDWGRAVQRRWLYVVVSYLWIWYIPSIVLFSYCVSSNLVGSVAECLPGNGGFGIRWQCAVVGEALNSARGVCMRQG